jgi:hypothetical protein
MANTIYMKFPFLILITFPFNGLYIWSLTQNETPKITGSLINALT